MPITQVIPTPMIAVLLALGLPLAASCGGDATGQGGGVDVSDTQRVAPQDSSLGSDTRNPDVWTTSGTVTLSKNLFPPPWGAGDVVVRLTFPGGLGGVFAEDVVPIDRLHETDSLSFSLSTNGRPPGDLAIHAVVRAAAANAPQIFSGSSLLPHNSAATDVVIDQAEWQRVPHYCGSDPLTRAQRACVYEFVWRFAARNNAFLAGKEIDWETTHGAQRASILDAATETGFYRGLAAMVTTLKDYHWIYAGLPLVDQYLGCPAMEAILFGNRIYVANGGVLPDGVSAGDEITSLDGKPIAARIAEGAALYSRHHPLRFEVLAQPLLLCGPLFSDALVEVSTAAGPLSVNLERAELLELTDLLVRYEGSAEDLVTTDEFGGPGGKVAYLRVDSFSHSEISSAFDAALETFVEADAMVVDVRGNDGGLIAQMLRVVGRFVGEEMSPYNIIGPGDLVTPVNITPTGNWQFAGPVVVLIDESSFSASSMFASAMRARGATLVGRHTGGGTSPMQFNRYELTTESYLGTSSDVYCDLEGDGINVDLVGVAPDYNVPLRLEDAVSGVAYHYGAQDDPVLGRALEVLEASLTH